MKTKPIDFLLSTIFITMIVFLSVIPSLAISKNLTQEFISDYHVLLDAFLFLLFYGTWSAILLRLMMLSKPFKAGTYSMDDTFFTYWKLYTVIYEFGRGALLPFTTVFSKPLIAAMFGTKTGKNIALGGHLVDPQLISIGDLTIIGQDSVITAHTINSGTIILKPVSIGTRVTIGVHAVIMSGVQIGEGSVVTAGAVVTPDTQIPANELWGGVPAKKIKALNIKPTLHTKK